MTVRSLTVLPLLIALASCGASVEQQVAPSDQAGSKALSAQPSATPMERENDRICRLMYGVECHRIPHLLGPINADGLGEGRACIREGIAIRVNGEWVHDNKYQNPEAGERYGDACIVVSL